MPGGETGDGSQVFRPTREQRDQAIALLAEGLPTYGGVEVQHDERERTFSDFGAVDAPSFFGPLSFLPKAKLQPKGSVALDFGATPPPWGDLLPLPGLSLPRAPPCNHHPPWTMEKEAGEEEGYEG